MTLKDAFNSEYTFNKLYKFVTKDCDMSDLLALKVALTDPDPKTRWTPGVRDWCDQYHADHLLNVINGRIKVLLRQ